MRQKKRQSQVQIHFDNQTPQKKIRFEKKKQNNKKKQK